MTEILTIDCGGSKTALALWQIDCSGLPRRLAARTIPTDFADEQELLARLDGFLAGRGPECCVLAFAGPTASADGLLRLTNNPCLLEPAALQRGLGCRLAILNDLEALAHALPALHRTGALRRICGGEANPASPALAAAVGTGLGVAARLPGGRVIPTEAGHCAYAPEGAAQQELWLGLKEFLQLPCNEQLLSGSGLCNILRALRAPCAPAEFLQDPALITACALGELPAGPALRAACRRVFALFSEAAGAILSNLALCFLSGGGVYIGGGVTSKIGGLFDEKLFAAAFAKQGAFQSLLAGIPVWLIEEADAVSLGAAVYADHYLLG